MPRSAHLSLAHLATVVLIAAVMLAAGSPAMAITVGATQADVDAHLVTAPSDYDGVAYTPAIYGCSGTLIGPRQILTAGHVVAGYLTNMSAIPFKLELADGPHWYTIERIDKNPTIDVALVTLTQSTGLPGYPMYGGSSEDSNAGGANIVKIAGYGRYGTGLTGGNSGVVNSSIGIGTKHWAANKLDFNILPGDTTFRYDFDQFGGVTDEGLIAEGDSGGGTFRTVSGIYELVGIHSSVTYVPPNAPGRYGDVATDVRVSAIRSWVMTKVPGDANADAKINAADYTIWAGHYGQTLSGGASVGDFNLDGVVDGLDWSLWADNYGFGTGQVSGGGGMQPLMTSASDYPSVPVPEPLTAALLLPLALLRRRR